MLNNVKELTGWHTIAEINAALPQLSVSSLKTKATAAQKRKEKWVTLEHLEKFPYQRRIIDTDSPAFQQLLQQVEARNYDPFEDESFGIFPYSERSVLPFSLSESQAVMQMEESSSCREIWPELCQWLSEQGVCVFWNTLADDDKGTWQWHWDSLSGNGYTSEASAILAAIQAKVEQGEHAIALQAIRTPDIRSSFFSEPPPAPGKKRWFS